MAKIARSISARVNSAGTSEIYLRVTLSRSKQLRVRSGVFVRPERFRNGAFVYPRADRREIALLRDTERRLAELEDALITFCLESPPEDVTREALERETDRFHHPEKYGLGEDAPKDFFEVWEEFLECRDLSRNREDIYRSLARALHRYEMHRRETREAGYRLDIDTLEASDISSFEEFYRNEWRYYDEYPDIYLKYPAELRLQRKTHRPQRRGDNIVVNTLKRLRAFFNWCLSQGITSNRPFDKFAGIKAERYGTPYFLTIEERDRIADFDFSARPGLEAQRDIFIFQCLVGCRVSDLKRLERSNVIGDMIEYIPRKTLKERCDAVRVPLCARAQAIIARRSAEGRKSLLPCISDQRYNDAIKEICRLAGIDRKVTIINPTTGKDERRPIYEVASSHMARRTFVGNLYRQVKDANLVSALSGHKEGSKAFARYRDIDDDMKRSLIDLIK